MSFLARRTLGHRLSSLQSTKTTLTSTFCRIRRFNSTDTPDTPERPRLPRSLRDAELQDAPAELVLNEGGSSQIDWSKSFHGLSIEPFPKEVADILQARIDPLDVQIMSGGLVYIPEIRYVRILNEAFGPGGWSMVPRGEAVVTTKVVTREYALICHNRLVSIARGEQPYTGLDTSLTDTEGCKSVAMTRCCKDLGVASQLWDPRWTKAFKKLYCESRLLENELTGKKKIVWARESDPIEPGHKLVSERPFPAKSRPFIIKGSKE